MARNANMSKKKQGTRISLLLFVIGALYVTTACSAEITSTHLSGSRQENIQYQMPGDLDHEPPLAEERDEASIMSYEALFSSLDGSLLKPRQDSSGGTKSLKNNLKLEATLSLGDTQQFKFSANDIADSKPAGNPILPPSIGQVSSSTDDTNHLELKRRQTQQREVFISLSVCQQPVPSSSKTKDPPPALELYISSSKTCSAGPDTDDPQTKLLTQEGFVKHAESTSTDICLAVRAPDASGYSGSYEIEIAASIDTYYADHHEQQGLFLLDSDSKAGLFLSTNLTDERMGNGSAEKWLAVAPPFSVFIHNQNDTSINGLRDSFCGLNRSAQIKGLASSSSEGGIEFGMSTIGGNLNLDVQPAKQQFYVPGLNSSSSYYAFMGLASNFSKSGLNSPTGGGQVWNALEFNTKTYDNCQLVYNLTTCPSVAYAAPSNNKRSAAELSKMYDDYANSFTQNFSYSMQQIPCDTEREAKYSLATGCDNCTRAYTQWLCAVTVPRCEDYDSSSKWLQPRNVGKKLPSGELPQPLFTNSSWQNHLETSSESNASRNTWIDDIIQPGPYKEVMPCGSLCYGLVQNCPSSLGFACPGKDPRGGFNRSYGEAGDDPMNPHCNHPGAVWGVNGAAQSQRPLLFAMGMASIITALTYSRAAG